MRPQTPLDPQPRFLEVDSRPLCFTETGSGRPVVAVHGLPANSRDFRWLDAAFDGRVRFFRVDLPGFGNSAPADRHDAGPSGLGPTVAGFCKATGLEDVVVLGHSMGGPAALDATLRTDRITRLVLVNSSGPIHHRTNKPRAYRALSRIGDIHPWVQRAMTTVAKPVLHRLGFSKKLSDEEIERACRLCGFYDAAVVKTQLQQLDKPALVVWSPSDPSVQAVVSEAILEAAPHATSLPIDARSHNLQATHATELAEAVLNWLA